MLIVRATLSAAAFVLTSICMAPADDWPPPQIREVFSQDRAYFVRVMPGTSWGDTVGFAGATKGEFARAEWYKRQSDLSYELIQAITLRNPVAPVDFYVSNFGHLITRDNWHNRGYGVVIAIYRSDGKLVGAYRLADLFRETEIAAMPRSVSSISWHAGSGAYIQPDQAHFLMTLNQRGAVLIVDLASGGFQRCQWQGKSYHCR